MREFPWNKSGQTKQAVDHFGCPKRIVRQKSYKGCCCLLNIHENVMHLSFASQGPHIPRYWQEQWPNLFLKTGVWVPCYYIGARDTNHRCITFRPHVTRENAVKSKIMRKTWNCCKIAINRNKYHKLLQNRNK